MTEPTTFATSTTATTSSGVPAVGFDIFAIIGNASESGGGFSLGGIFTILAVLWGIIVVFGYLISIALLVLYVYASVRKTLYEDLNTQVLRDEEKLYDQHFRGSEKNDRMSDVFDHIASSNPNDWKLSIIEADIILDDTLKQKGYAGNSLGERLKSISPNQLASLQDAWEAHKVRNRIAHEGSDFILTQRLAQETVARYKRVFDEFGIN